MSEIFNISVLQQSAQALQNRISYQPKISKQENFIIKSKSFLFLQTINICLGAMYYGYSYVEYNILQINFHLLYKWNQNEQTIYDGLISGFMSIGAFLAAFISQKIIYKDRRKLMIIFDLVGIMSCLLMLIRSIPTILIGRLLAGCITGLNTVFIPIYIMENSPDSIYGQMVQIPLFQNKLHQCGFFTVGCCTGMFLVVNFALLLQNNYTEMASNPNTIWWRFILGFLIIASLIRSFFLIFVFKYDTIHNLILNFKEKQKENIVKLLKHTIIEQNIEEEIEKIVKKYSNQERKIPLKVVIRNIELFTKKYRYRFLAAQLICFFKQFSGIAAVLFYSTYIMTPSLNPTSVQVLESKIFTIILSVVMTISSFLSTKLIDKLGRKFILYSGFFITTILLILLSLCGYLKFKYYHLIIEIIIVIYMFVLSLSVLAVSFVIVPELLPPIGVSISIMTNFLAQALVGIIFPQMMRYLQIRGSFLIFAGFCLISFIYCFFFLHETKGKTPKQIEQEYENLDNNQFEATMQIKLYYKIHYLQKEQRQMKIWKRIYCNSNSKFNYQNLKRNGNSNQNIEKQQ